MGAQSPGKGGSGGGGNMAGQNIFEKSAGSMDTAMGSTQGWMGLNAPQNYGDAIQPYMNPYTQNVINRTMGDIREQRDMALNQVGGQANLAGAFGGSRHGLVESNIYRDALDTSGDISASLRNQNFQQAGQGFGDAFGRNISGAGMLGNLGGQAFDMGRQINQDQIGAGNISRGINQSMLDSVQNMFGQFTGQPQNALQTMLSAMQLPGGVGTTTTTGDDGGAQTMMAIGALLAAISTRELKENIIEDNSPSKLFDIKTYDFNYIETMKIREPQYGMIAEEIAEIFPAAVIKDVHGDPVAINAVPLVAELIKTVKQLKAEIDELRIAVGR